MLFQTCMNFVCSAYAKDIYKNVGNQTWRWVNDDSILFSSGLSFFHVGYCLACHRFVYYCRPQGYFVSSVNTAMMCVFLQERWTLQCALRRCRAEICVERKWWLCRTKAELILWCRVFWCRYVPLLYVSFQKPCDSLFNIYTLTSQPEIKNYYNYFLNTYFW